MTSTSEATYGEQPTWEPVRPTYGLARTATHWIISAISLVATAIVLPGIHLNGITGASVGSGRTLEVTLDLKDALFDAGYTLHVDASVEDRRDSPDDVKVPLTSAGAGTPVKGRRYVSTFTYGM